MIAWVLDKRNKKTFKRLYDKVKHLKGYIFYTGGWEVSTNALPKKRHIAGKPHTHIVESNNSNTRHHPGRFTRKTKVVSKCEKAVGFAMKPWFHLSKPDAFCRFQMEALSIYF